MANKTTKSPTYAVLPHRQGDALQDVFFLHIQKTYCEGNLIEEDLVWQYQSPCFPAGLRDNIIALLAKAGMTVRYFDAEESKWMDISTTGGLEPAKGNRDGTWAQPSLEQFKEEYLGVRFKAAAVG